MAAFDAAGVKLDTLTYDEVDALADYSNAMGATFTMLSDPNSEVIRAFGILNTLIPPDEHPWYGIPFYLVGHNPKSGYSLDRRQTELVAGRVSALNECFY